jgi:hypothetical protein
LKPNRFSFPAVKFHPVDVLIAVFLLFALIGATCHKNANLTPGQQTQLNLYKTLNAISIGNKAAIQSITALNAQKLISDPVTRAFLGYSQQVNDAERAGLKVLDSAETPEQKATAVLELLKKLDLPPPVKAFVNSSPTAAAVVSVIQSIVSIQQAIAQVLATPPALLSVDKGA